MRTILLICISLFILSCNEDEESLCDYKPLEGSRFFEFRSNTTGQVFIAWTNRQAVIQQVESQLALDEENRSMHINGAIMENNTVCPYNYNWSWYFDPMDWSLSEFSIEVCDGNPEYVEENLDDYLHIGRYCPWSSIVVREVDSPFR